MVSSRNVARLLAGTFLFAGTAGAAHAETRALSLINVHTQERATVVFKRDGVYDQQGLQELNRLLRDWRRNEVTRMDPALFDLVWEVYRRTGATEPINIVCGYRSPATNNMLRSRSRGVAKFSQHMLGKAMDFYLPGVNLETLRETGMKMQVGGVGFYPTSGSPFVHMDTGSVRAWPRMTREQLVRLFPDGKTAHLPSDGTPLPGYQTALAEVEARKAAGGGPVASSSSSSGGGLLAALFGGGSSSSSSSYTASAAPGEDEEETAAAPASRRQPQQQQELRQGPLPPGSNPRILAKAGDVPPGVDLGPAAPQETARGRRAPVQQVASAEVPLPVAVPRAAVPTATAGGSLVAMPVAPAAVGPTKTAAATAIPSRYGPQPDALPPGWVQGPSGQPVGDARAAAAGPQKLAFTPGLKPIVAPLPQARPGAQPELIAMAVIPAQGRTPIAVTLPKPRPTGALRVADAAAGTADPYAALSAFAGENDGVATALGYAAEPAAAPEMRTAALDAPATASASVARSLMPPPAAAALPADRAGLLRGKADRTVSAPRAAGKTDRADADRIYDAAGRTEGEGFAVLKHPDQNAIDPLLEKPRLSLATGFVTASLEQGFGAHTFSGPAVISLPVILTK